MKQKRAVINLRHEKSERWKSFRTGIEKCGFVICDRNEFVPTERDILVTWNRFPDIEGAARQVEAAGGLVIVAENCWITPPGEKRGGMVALCASHHNGPGWWLVGDPERWNSFDIEISPWRSDGEHVLILPQRGYGEPGVAMPQSWTPRVVGLIQQHSRRSIMVRNHPGMFLPKEPSFKKTWAVATWASGAAIKALVAGIPVFYELKNWIGATAAKYGFDDIEHPFLGDRLSMFQRLAWAQWYLDEIETGEPFMRCLQAKHFV